MTDDEAATLRIITCPDCDGEGRDVREGPDFSPFDGALHVHDYGPCRLCGGTGQYEIEVEPITLEDLERAP